MDELLRAIAQILRVLAPFTPVLISFALAWSVFEITERRRRHIEREATRIALRAELERAELILSSLVYTYAAGSSDPTKGVKEFRWFVLEAPKRWPRVEQPPQELVGMLDRSDEELAESFKKMQAPTRRGLVVSIPVLTSVLASPSLGYQRKQIERLSEVQWQIHLVAEQAAEMQQWRDLTFSITDPTNHKTVMTNFEGSRDSYRKRLGFTLDAVRDALEALGRETRKAHS